MTSHVKRAIAALGGDQTTFSAAAMRNSPDTLTKANDALKPVSTQTIQSLFGVDPNPSGDPTDDDQGPTDEQIDAFLSALSAGPDDAEVAQDEGAEEDDGYLAWC